MRAPRVLLTIATFAALAALTNTIPAFADIQISLNPLSGAVVSVSVDIVISGEIKNADADALERPANENAARLSWPIVNLNSDGGDVYAAMRIGRFIRKFSGTTIVLENNRCLSSCALIYIAGVHRGNDGIIGLHRPYLASPPQERRKVEQQIPKMFADIEKYVAEMDVTQSFYELMVNTEPSEMRLFRGDEIASIVPRTDPTQEEIDISRLAREHGISTVEMRHRKSEAATCYSRFGSTSSDELVCEAAIEWGLRESVYRARIRKTNACILGPTELETLRQISAEDRLDDPVLIKHENCVRAVMLGGGSDLAYPDDWEVVPDAPAVEPNPWLDTGK